MKSLNELLNHDDEELREFAKCFEGVAEYTDLEAVTLNKLIIGIVSRALCEPLTHVKTGKGTHYTLELLVRDKPVEFNCFVPNLNNQ